MSRSVRGDRTAPIPAVSPVADVLAGRGLDGWLTPPLVPVGVLAGVVVGEAVTVQLAVEGPGDLTPLRELVSGDLTGSVLVLAGLEGFDGAIWGEIMTRSAVGRGAVAVLVDGLVRDRTAVAAEGLAVCARGGCVAGPQGRVAAVSVGEPVTVGSVVVAAGDTVVVDDGGAVRIPAGVATEVLEAAVAYEAAERRVLESLAAGEVLRDAYRHKS